MATRYKMEDGQRVLMTDAEEASINTTPEFTALEYLLIQFRKKRDRLLKETDWMANSDVTMSDDWKTYRQALRDLPSGLNTVEKVNAKEFPTKPGV
tara:strand:+ start:738 stop:1025 length:288 start_codon:yes stop_codon:yes gene_type:complete